MSTINKTIETPKEGKTNSDVRRVPQEQLRVEHERDRALTEVEKLEKENEVLKAEFKTQSEAIQTLTAFAKKLQATIVYQSIEIANRGVTP